MGLEVLLYVPNVIDYVRLVLLVASWVVFQCCPLLSVVLYCISASLDAIDGYLARTLGQTSEFGAWLDVVIDIIGRGMLWCQLYNFGYLVACVEWITFTCTSMRGAEWKKSYAEEPLLVRLVMAQNFKTPLGVLAVGSLQLLPIWLLCCNGAVFNKYILVPEMIQYSGIAVFAAGRALCMFVEIWCIWLHIRYLTEQNGNKSETSGNK